jgi:ABC-type transporter MlaC component
MKNSILIGILLVILFLLVTALPARAETTQVCIDVKDRTGQPVKDTKGKVKQSCKTMKKHKKLEGTKVPDKK